MEATQKCDCPLSPKPTLPKFNQYNLLPSTCTSSFQSLFFEFFFRDQYMYKHYNFAPCLAQLKMAAKLHERTH